MRKIYWMLAVVGILCMGIIVPDRVSAATVYDSASDDTIATANAINMGDTISGSITENDDLDYYKFQLGSASCVTLNMTSYMKYYSIIIYDSDGEKIWYTDSNVWIESVGYRRDTYNLYLERGTYYMQINGYLYRDWGGKSTGTYNCRTSSVSSGVNNVESDNSFATANKISLGSTIKGQISVNDDLDTFEFVVSKPGLITLDMTSYMEYYRIKVFDLDGDEICHTDRKEWTESVGYRRDTYNLYLEKGTYYMQINGYYWSDSTGTKSTGTYSCRTKFTSSGVSFDGDDNSFATAKSISWNKNYTGQISLNDGFDTYKFVVSSGRTVTVNMVSYMRYYCIKIFDQNGNEIWYTDYNEWNDKVGYRKDTHSVVLSAGTYYMQINGYLWHNSTSTWSTGKYKFSIGTSTVKKPAQVKSVSAVKMKKALKVKWKKVSGAKGYQICYSTSSMFKSKKVKTTTSTSFTLKKLKAKKTYYVKVRAYKVKNGEKVYGKYSKVIKKKTK